jgi:hypothetical protein
MKAADPTIKIGFNFIDDALPHELFKPGVVTSGNPKLFAYNADVLKSIVETVDFMTFHEYIDFGIENDGKCITNLSEIDWKNVFSQIFFKEKYGVYEAQKKIMGTLGKEAGVYDFRSISGTNSVP